MAHSENFEFKQNALSEAGRKNWDDIFGKEEIPNEEDDREELKDKGPVCSSE